MEERICQCPYFPLNNTVKLFKQFDISEMVKHLTEHAYIIKCMDITDIRGEIKILFVNFAL